MSLEIQIRPGATLGRYEVLVPVGQGGMAEVWVARVLQGARRGQLVALKMILPELAENVAFQEMFGDEARIASRVVHPNVCKTFELGEERGIRFLAMEWVDGTSLARLLETSGEGPASSRRPKLDARVAARILAHVCAGLHSAHELLNDDGTPLGVVHRDVSPANVLITRRGEIKITDFGVAKAVGKAHRTLAGQLKGKLQYMSPEQLLDGANIDRRSDIFSLGCVLHEATTGRQTFAGSSDPQIMRAILLNLFEPPRALVPDYPVELEDVVVRALTKDRGDRFATAERMRWALEGYLHKSGPPVTAQHVAELTAERCGAEIEALSGKIKAAVERSTRR